MTPRSAAHGGLQLEGFGGLVSGGIVVDAAERLDGRWDSCLVGHVGRNIHDYFLGDFTPETKEIGANTRNPACSTKTSAVISQLAISNVAKKLSLRS